MFPYQAGIRDWVSETMPDQSHLEQLVSYLDASLVGETVVTDRRHEDATVAARLYLDAQWLLCTLLYTDVASLSHLRPATVTRLTHVTTHLSHG